MTIISNALQALWKTTTSSATSTQQTNNTKSTTSLNATAEDDMQTLEISSTENLSEEELIKQTYEAKIEQCKMELVSIQQEMENINTQRQSLLTQMCSPDVDITSIMSQFQKLGSAKTQLFGEIASVNANIQTLQNQMMSALGSLDSSLSQMSDTVTSYSTTLTSIPNLDTNSEVGELASQMGQAFVGVINSDAQGNAEFSPGGRSQHWCADFATTITKRAYEAKGMSIPSGFGSSAVSGLMSWGKENGIYLDTASNSNRASAIANSVKPGDLMIQKRNGTSHTGIVTKVYPDGSFDTVEGNSSDAVKNRHYSTDSAKLSGFVLMNALG